jgi:hypothetical protein
VGNIKEINLFEDKGTDNRVILKRIWIWIYGGGLD